MARILIGWELGANRGHVIPVLAVARRLAGEGHEVSVALQNTCLAEAELPPSVSLWQSPLWPGLLNSNAGAWSLAPSTMGDILARLGLNQPGVLAGLVRAWDAILAATDADLVVADYAPALLAAARGRATTIITGSGFICPPADLSNFPSLTGDAPVVAEEDLLDIADADLADCARDALPALPALFASDHVAISTFQQLDPYAEVRLPNSYCMPNLPFAVPETPAAKGDEIFVYGYNKMGPELALWDALANTGKPVRIFVPQATQAQLDRFAALRFHIEHRPVPIPEIARRSRLLVSHGGHGFSCAALLAGLPHFIAWYDLEKMLFARAVAELGTGDGEFLTSINAMATAENLKQLWENDDLHDRAMAVATALALSNAPMAEDRISSIAAGL